MLPIGTVSGGSHRSHQRNRTARVHVQRLRSCRIGNQHLIFGMGVKTRVNKLSLDPRRGTLSDSDWHDQEFVQHAADDVVAGSGIPHSTRQPRSGDVSLRVDAHDCFGGLGFTNNGALPQLIMAVIQRQIIVGLHPDDRA